MAISPAHLAHLATSGLSPEICHEAGIYTETDGRALADTLGRKNAMREQVPAIMFPFFEPGKAKPSFARAKPDVPRANSEKPGKVIKYEQPPKRPTMPYFPPRSRESRLRDTSLPLHITEGEKKGLCLDQMGYAAIALVGVDNFHDVEHRKATGEYRLHEKLREHVVFDDRVVVIVFDGDARKPDKPGIYRAAVKLARTLLASGAREVFLVLPPEDAEEKGIDDFYAAHGEAATKKLLVSARERFDPSKPWGGMVRPTITVLTQEHKTNDMAARALAGALGVYQRGGQLVRVIRDGRPRDGVARTVGAPRIAPMPKAILRERLTEAADWEKLDGDGAEPTHPPEWSVLAVLERGEWPGVSHLDGIVEIPVLRPNGTVLSSPGYDPVTQLLYEPCGLDLEVPERPTQADAIRARDELLDVVSDFPFASDADRAAWLAAVLTPFTRYAGVDTAPLFLVDANTRGSGKTLLADTVGMIATGRGLARTVWIASDDEMRKQITACALAGDSIVLIDNVVGSLGSASFDAALTSSTWKARILGRSENTPDLPMRITWFATGNNTVLVADTGRRTLRIRLEAQDENPEDRDGFKRTDLLRWISRERSRLVTAALTILRAYTSAGMPAAGLGAWGSFDAWSQIVRGAVVWAGCADPKATQIEVRDQGDDEARSLRSLIMGIERIDRAGRGVTARDILDSLHHDNLDDHEALRDAVETLSWLKPGAELPSAKSLGKTLRRFHRRVVAGKYLEHEAYQGTMRWRVLEAGLGGFGGIGGFPTTPAGAHANNVVPISSRAGITQKPQLPPNPPNPIPEIEERGLLEEGEWF